MILSAVFFSNTDDFQSFLEIIQCPALQLLSKDNSGFCLVLLEIFRTHTVLLCAYFYQLEYIKKYFLVDIESLWGNLFFKVEGNTGPRSCPRPIFLKRSL